MEPRPQRILTSGTDEDQLHLRINDWQSRDFTYYAGNPSYPHATRRLRRPLPLRCRSANRFRRAGIVGSPHIGGIRFGATCPALSGIMAFI